MKYRWKLGLWDKVFAVPACVVEKYIRLASGKAVKVLLYLLCHSGEEQSSEAIAKALGISEEEADDAVLFWSQLELMEEAPEETHEAKAETPAPLQIKHEMKEASVAELQLQKTAPAMTPGEIARRIDGDEEMQFLFSGAEALYGELMNHTRQRSLIWMRDYLGLSADVLLMLMEYCKSVGKLNVRYVEKAAVSWQEMGIVTHEAADREITRLKNLGSYQSKVKRIFGIGERNLSTQQEKFISDWSHKGISLDLVAYAYDKAADQGAKNLFSYVNTVLLKWYGDGLDTREKIDREQPAYKKKEAASAGQTSYDLELFDKLAVNHPGKE